MTLKLIMFEKNQKEPVWSTQTLVNKVIISKSSGKETGD